MKRILIVSIVAVATLSLTAVSAIASPSSATNYAEYPASCEGLGGIVIQINNVGQWGAGKVQGTRLTLVPRTFAFTGTSLDTGEVVFEESFGKRTHDIDDTCTFSFVEEVPEGDEFLPPGTYEFTGTVGVRVVGSD
jgi:hypothetical protein